MTHAAPSGGNKRKLPGPLLSASAFHGAKISEVAETVIREALERSASDIHLILLPAAILVRFRIDGLLRDAHFFPLDMGRKVVNHFKILGEMDITEHRRPQDGRILCEVGGRSVDLRLASTPTLNGENLAIRIFNKDTATHRIEDLGLSRREYNAFYDLVHSPHGLALVTGPTGAGKTTTLYAILNELNTPEKNIVTVEDPVEYDIERASQIPVNSKIGMGFVDSLRSAFRQDPDVLMIGEIREPEGARIAVRAALAGRMVFSTLHTATAAGAVAALHHYGIEPFALANSLTGVIAQQLVRKICPSCRSQVALDPEDLGVVEREVVQDLLGSAGQASLSYGEGCEKCHHSGYLGRTGIFEILTVDEDIRRMILNKAPARDIEAKAAENGMLTLRLSGFQKIVQGITTVEELLRVVPVPDQVEVG